jgi:hypothetical protein
MLMKEKVPLIEVSLVLRIKEQVQIAKGSYIQVKTKI